MTNNEKLFLYAGISAVVIFIAYKVFNKPKDNRLRKPDGTFVETIPQSIIDAQMQKVKDGLEAKRLKYEAIWKKSGSKLSFKDWYIENADTQPI
jgi:hypothetical protein